MTYDPLSYGQIKLRDRAANPGETPDDLLFEDAGPGYTSDEAPQSDWAEPAAEFGTLGVGNSPSDFSQFDADVLGESTSDEAPVRSPVPSPAPTPRAGVARRRIATGSAPAVAPAVKPPTAPPNRLPRRSPGTQARRPVRRSGRVMGMLIPSAVLACGGSTAGWFYMMEQNMVMAGIVAATSLVGAALARVMFR